MMAIAPTLDIYLPYLIGFLYTAWCGAIVLSMLEVMRRPECKVKQYSSHTLFIINSFLQGIMKGLYYFYYEKTYSMECPIISL